MECDKTLASKKSINNYKKVFVDKMEKFMEEIEKVGKNQYEISQTNKKRKNGN